MSKKVDIITEHRNMLMVSKKISDWQEAQLKNWPLIVFDGIKSVKIKYDFISKEDNFYEGKVEYIFEFKENSPEGTVKEKGIESLTNWTKSIFWTDTEISFKIGNKKWT